MTIEELQIVISAKTESVHAKIDKLKEKIASVQPKKAADVDVTTDKAQGNLKKLQAEIDRTQAKISKLNAKMADVYAKQDAIVSKYSDVPNLSGMSHDQTLDFMVGKDPKMQEFNAQLDQLEAQTAPLKAHLADVKAQITQAGNAAEPAAAKTRQLGENMRTAGGHIQNAGRSSGYFGQMCKSMLLSMALYQGVSFVMKSISGGIQNMALGNAQANSTMSQLASSALYLKNSIAAALMPALQALTPVIVQIADGIAWAANQVAIFIAQVTGQKTVTIAQKTYVDYAKSLDKAGDSASRANKKVKELQRTIMGFDELNVLQKNVDSAGGGGAKSNIPDYGSMFKTIKTPPSAFDSSKIQKAFDTLKDGADKAGKALDRVKNRATEAAKELQRVRLPALGSWKVPVFPRVRVPALDTGEYDKSKNKYQQPVHAPLVSPATAPAIILRWFWESKANYQAPVTPPLVRPALAPAMNLNSQFIPSLDSAIQRLEAFSSTTQALVRTWGTNVSSNFGKTWSAVSSATGVALDGVKNKISAHGRTTSTAFATVGNHIMKNARLTFSFIPVVVAGGLNAAGKGVSSWLNSVSGGFSRFGTGVITIMSAAMEGLFKTFVSGLSAAWNQFTGFMSGIGQHIGNWWNANKSWAAPTAAAVGLVALNVGAAIITGGASIPAQAALAGATGLATGGLVTGPTYSLIGEGKDSEAVLPLNSDVYSRIGRGISENDNSSLSKDVLLQMDDISKRLGSLEKAILERPVTLYANDKKIAESANRGNQQIDRRYHPIAQT